MPKRWRSPYDRTAYEQYNPTGFTLKKYGLTREKYQELFAKQNGLCAICGETLYVPHIDHNHKTNRVRGLLCGNCNTRLVAALEDPMIEKAKRYLRKFREGKKK